MSIAVLVLAHSCPATLAATAKVLTASPSISVLVHLDAKIDITQYKAKLGDGADTRLAFCNTRHDVFWAGFSMIEATISLIEMGLKLTDASFFSLVSDDSFPLLNGPDLVAAILDSGLPRIQTWKVPNDHLFRQRYDKFYFMDSKFSNPRWFLNEDRSVNDSEIQSVIQLNSLKTYGKYPLPELYCGKQWWALPRFVCEEIVALHYSNKLLRESFKFSAVPDETYLQTLFRLTFPSADTLPHPMYDDFARFPKPYVFSNCQEVKDCDLSNRLFIRKAIFKSQGEYEELLRICSQ